ncbi:TRAFAC clade GTPase domain-containing protein [Kibdelosporangium aridum]|uniref:TRAFAC clade GTPase domain-containing protein n=1 Tax=Kibdelosporangium aridum TaxID=2030 RepID=UPI0005250061
MQYLIGALAVLFGIYIIFWLVVVALFYLVLPIYLVLMPLSLAAGMVISVVIVMMTLIGARKYRPETITPEHVTDGTARLPKLPSDRPFGRDWAWPSYVVAQWRVDFTTATRGVWDILGRGWRTLPRKIGWIASLFVFPVWLAVNAGAFLAGAMMAAPWLTFVLLTWLGWLAVGGVLRGADNAFQRVRDTRPRCQVCHYLADLPAFPCECGKLHRDVRPGRLGGVWRRCGCGRVLPTTILRAALKIGPSCPRCARPYHKGAGVNTDIGIPVFGPVSAGKTRLVIAGMVALRDLASANGVVTEFVDEDSENAYRTGADIITTDGNTAKTPAGELPIAITMQVTKGRRKTSLHIFDAAGEFYTNRDDNADLEFLDHAKGLVLVVDPFSIPWVTDQLGGPYHPRVAVANPAVDDPDQTYQVTVRRLRDYRIDTKRRNLAIAVVKADLLTGTDPAEDLEPATVRDWLDQAGLDNLVLSAERDFAEVRYFLVASVRVRPETAAMSPAAPFVWLLSKAGVDVVPPEAKQ